MEDVAFVQLVAGCEDGCLDDPARLRAAAEAKQRGDAGGQAAS
jgi:hypothetical protein